MIISDNEPPEIVSQLLGIVPHRTHTKGEMSVSRTSGSLITQPKNLWCVRTETIVSNQEGIKKHIQQLKSLLQSKIDLIANYKNQNRFEMIFWIWIETEDAGIGLELTGEELEFINKISHTVHVSLLTNQDIGKDV
jgi:hypothetical protein